MITAGVIWGTLGIAVRLVHERSGLSPLTISAYRTLAAVLVLTGAIAVRRRLAISWAAARSHGRRIAAVGLLTIAFQVLFFVAVVASGVSVATVICLGFAPVLLLVIDSVRQRRLPAATHLLTVVMAIAGLLLVSLLGSGPGDQASSPLIGVVSALASGAAFGLSAEVARPLSQALDTLTITVATLAVAAAVLVPGVLAVAYVRGDPLTTTDLPSWLLLVYLGVVTMALAYALLYAGLRSTSSGVAMIATLVEPVVAVLLAVLLLHEQLTLAGAVGCLLIVAAIGSLGRQSDPPPQ